MKKYFARLSSMERRFVVGVLVVVFVVLNAMFVWPRFSDWGQMQTRMDKARRTAKIFEAEKAEEPKYKKQVMAMESEGLAVPPEDQSIDFLRTIQSEAAKSGVTILGNTRQISRTNQFFLEQAQSLTVQSSEQQLVDFLYNLGSGNSLIRVRGLSLRPDPPRQLLAANITLIASYQKKPVARRAASPATAAAAAPREAGKPATPTDKKP
jgi:Tfp pilus assembly protein PilO